MVAQSAEFKKAVEDSRSLSKTPSNDELLEVITSKRQATSPSTKLTIPFSTQIYGLFKQGTGEKYEDATKPGAFDFKVRPLELRRDSQGGY